MSSATVTRLASAQDASRAIALVETLVGPFKPEEKAVARTTFVTLCDGVRGEIRLAFAADDAEEHSLLGVCTMSFPMALRFSTPGVPKSEYAVLEEMVVGKEGRGMGIGGELLQVRIHPICPSQWALSLPNSFCHLSICSFALSLSLSVQAAIDSARARGCAEMGLFVVNGLESRPFYEKMGFDFEGSAGGAWCSQILSHDYTRMDLGAMDPEEAARMQAKAAASRDMEDGKARL